MTLVEARADACRGWFLTAATLFLFLTACSSSDPAPTVELRTPTPRAAAPTSTTAPTVDVPSPTPVPSATLQPSPTATITQTPAPTSTSTSTATPEPTATPTATPLPPTPTVAEGAIAITAILNDPPVGRDSDGETVTIVNGGEAPIDMTGWSLSDIAEHTYVFPSFVLQPGAAVVVHICSGEDTAEILYWGHCSAVWNNDGDTAYLRDATGREISTFSY